MSCYIKWASGLGVMTSRLQRGGQRFNSALAHYQKPYSKKMGWGT